MVLESVHDLSYILTKIFSRRPSLYVVKFGDNKQAQRRSFKMS